MLVRLNVIAAAAVAIVAGAASAQDMVVKIGHVGPMSGPQAFYGKDNENGARMAVEELNAKGVTIGGKKVKFEFIAEDDAADPKQGTAAAQKLCDSKVNGVVGHLNSGTTIPASKVYNDCGIPHITPSATNPKLTQNGYKTTFRLLANDNALGAGLALHAANNLKLKKIASGPLALMAVRMAVKSVALSFVYCSSTMVMPRAIAVFLKTSATPWP